MQHCPFDVEGRDAKEKPVVVDELRLSEDNPFKKLTEAVLGVVFDRSGYAHMTSGYIDDVKQTTQARLYNFWETFYGPNNAVMVVVGPVVPQKILRYVHKHFNFVKPREVKRENRDEVPQNGPRQVFLYTKKPYTMAQLAFRAMEGKHKDSVVLDLISEIMQYPKFGIMSVLKEMNAVPQFGIMNNRTKRRNVFQVTGSLATPNGINLFQSALWKWFAAISDKNTAIDDKVLMMAKKNLTNKWNNAMQGVESMSSLATEAVAMGSINDIWDKVEHLQKVTLEDVQRVAHYTFQPSRCTLGVLCPEPMANVLRPLIKSPEYFKQLFSQNILQEAAMTGVQHLEAQNITKGDYELERFDCNFGKLQHLKMPTTKKNMFFISTKPASTNEMLSRIATRLIVDGVKSVTMDHEQAHTFMFGKPSMDVKFSDVMIEKNLNFNLVAEKGRLMFDISFDHGHDLEESLMQVADAIKGVRNQLTQQNVALKASIVAGELAGSLHDMNFVAHKKITEIMFGPKDINVVNDPQTLIKSIDTITMEQLSSFINEVFDDNNAFSATVVSKENSSNVGKALLKFYQQFSNNAQPSVPEVKHISEEKKFKSETFRIVEPGKNDGVLNMGLRLKGLSRKSKDFTALRVATDVLGDGIYSLLNKKLRIELGMTYGTYARLRGGYYDSDSYLHLFGSFASNNLEKARDEADAIVRQFVANGITEQEFNDKRSHLKNSLRVRMDNNRNLLQLHHQTWLNDAEMTVSHILDRIDSLSHEDVNKCIKKYLSDSPVITVLAGLPK